MSDDTVKILNLIAQTIYDKKGFNIFAIDVRNFSTVTDYFVLAEGNVDKHVRILAKDIVDALKKDGITPFRVEGLDEGDWVVLDYLDVIIHLLVPDLRSKYCLEELWREGDVVDLQIKVKEPI